MLFRGKDVLQFGRPILSIIYIIEDESINHALSDGEVEGTDEEHQQESCSCKENE